MNNYSIALSDLDQLLDFDSFDPWSCGVISKDDIDVVTDTSIARHHVDGFDSRNHSFEYHSARCAYLAENGWTIDENPILLDVGFGPNDHLFNDVVIDGNHRILAALTLGLSRISVQYQGSEDYFFELFPDAREL